jgi:hypothetical protein
LLCQEAGGGNEEEEGEEEDGAADGAEHIDEYIRPPEMPPAQWTPLVAFLVVPRLPKE